MDYRPLINPDNIENGKWVLLCDLYAEMICRVVVNNIDTISQLIIRAQSFFPSIEDLTPEEIERKVWVDVHVNGKGTYSRISHSSLIESLIHHPDATGDCHAFITFYPKVESRISCQKNEEVEVDIDDNKSTKSSCVALSTRTATKRQKIINGEAIGIFTLQDLKIIGIDVPTAFSNELFEGYISSHFEMYR